MGTEMQYKLKKYGTRKSKKDQTLKELKKLNSEISHWYSLLFEAIMFYGSETTPNDIFYTGLNVQVLFDSFVPEFRAPFSTTIDHRIAEQFCKSAGVILKMQHGTGYPSHYFDVEWLSNFENERERLFFQVNNLRIIDIQTFDHRLPYSHKELIKALTLWSSLFGGCYSLNLKKNPQKILIAFIQNFNQNNNILSNGQIITNKFSLVMEQIFFNLTQKLKQKEEKIFIIRAECEKLDKLLKNELFSLENTKISLSQFLGSLIDSEDIKFMEEYIWILDKQQIKILRDGRKDVFVYSDSFYFELSKEHKVEFKIGLMNESSDKYTLFHFYIINSSQSVNGTLSICVDEIDYVLNAWPFYEKSTGKLIKCFEEKRFKQLTHSMTLRTAITFNVGTRMKKNKR